MDEKPISFREWAEVLNQDEEVPDACRLTLVPYSCGTAKKNKKIHHRGTEVTERIRSLCAPRLW
jgi:hypothetical protein